MKIYCGRLISRDGVRKDGCSVFSASTAVSIEHGAAFHVLKVPAVATLVSAEVGPAIKATVSALLESRREAVRARLVKLLVISMRCELFLTSDALESRNFEGYNRAFTVSDQLPQHWPLQRSSRGETSVFLSVFTCAWGVGIQATTPVVSIPPVLIPSHRQMADSHFLSLPLSLPLVPL